MSENLDDDEDRYDQAIIKRLVEFLNRSDKYSGDAAVARALNVSPQKFGRWKSGKSPVSTEGLAFSLLILSFKDPDRAHDFLFPVREALSLSNSLDELERQGFAIADKARKFDMPNMRSIREEMIESNRSSLASAKKFLLGFVDSASMKCNPAESANEALTRMGSTIEKIELIIKDLEEMTDASDEPDAKTYYTHAIALLDKAKSQVSSGLDEDIPF